MTRRRARSVGSDRTNSVGSGGGRSTKNVYGGRSMLGRGRQGPVSKSFSV